VTAPARSVFAEPLAQAREALEMLGGLLRFEEDQVAGDAEVAEVRAALDLIEQRATDMEKALREIERSTNSSAVQRIVRAALSAREAPS